MLTFTRRHNHQHTYTIRQGNMSNGEYIENFNNMMDMESEFNSQIHYQEFFDIVTEVK